MRIPCRYHALTVFFVLLAYGPAVGYDSHGAPFLEIGIDARQNAIGGAGGTIGGTASSYWWNPSGIAAAKAPQFQFQHTWMYDGFAVFNYAGGVIPLKNDVTVAVNGVLLSIPDVPEYPDLRPLMLSDREIEELIQANDLKSSGSFDAYDMALTVTVAKVFRTRLDLGWQYFVIPLEIPVGINFKQIKRKLGNHGSAYGTGIDAGILIRVDARKLFGEREFLGFFDVGLNIQDIGGTVVYWKDSDYDPVIPYNTKFCSGYEHPLTAYQSVIRLCYDYDFRNKDTFAGLEFAFRNTIAVRCGFNRKVFTAGAGLELFGGNIDYSFSMQDFGNIHRVSGGYRFGTVK